MVTPFEANFAAGFNTAPPLRSDDCIWPGWSSGRGAVSLRVKALATTRNGGVSAAPYGGVNGRGGLNRGRTHWRPRRVARAGAWRADRGCRCGDRPLCGVCRVDGQSRRSGDGSHRRGLCGDDCGLPAGTFLRCSRTRRRRSACRLAGPRGWNRGKDGGARCRSGRRRDQHAARMAWSGDRTGSL
jgi:hypothetical protein